MIFPPFSDQVHLPPYDPELARAAWKKRLHKGKSATRAEKTEGGAEWIWWIGVIVAIGVIAWCRWQERKARETQTMKEKPETQDSNTSNLLGPFNYG